MKSMMNWCWVMNGSRMVNRRSMMTNHVMLNNRSNMVSMTMHLMMFLVDSMVCAMVSYSMTDMMGGCRDGNMMSTMRHRSGPCMWVRRSCT